MEQRNGSSPSDTNNLMSSTAKRSVTPNATSSTPQTYEPLGGHGNNRVAYRPTYERISSQYSGGNAEKQQY